MKNVSLPLILLVLLGVACSPSPEQKVEVLQQEVLALHDSAMAKMGAMYTGRKTLTGLKDSIAGQDSGAVQSLTRGISDLTRADEKMMQWMRTYRNPENQTPEAALQYLQLEKKKIQQVQLDIDQSLRSADSLQAHYRTTRK